MGIFKRRDGRGSRRKRRSKADSRREQRWKKTQEIVRGLFPVSEFPASPPQPPAPGKRAQPDEREGTPTRRFLRTAS
jgi:hypothetical protein